MNNRMIIDKKKLYWLIGIVLLLLIFASSNLVKQQTTKNSSNDSYFGAGSEEMMGVLPEVASSSRMMAPNFYPEPSPELITTTDEPVDQKIIQNGSLELEVDNIDETITRISSIIKTTNGFVSQSNVGRYQDERRYGSILLRVPAESFSTAIDQIKKLALVVTNESISSNDVTEQFIDLTARLKNKKVQEQAFLDVLARASTVEEILKVQTAIAQVRGEIESLEGRIQYLENQADLSTISISLTEESAVSLPSKTFRPASTFKDAISSLITIAQELINGAIWFVIVGGGILIPLGLIALIVRFFIKRKH